ncbi:MAG: hypothetical protein AAGA66_16585 [Bacteroidota bacterium]
MSETTINIGIETLGWIGALFFLIAYGMVVAKKWTTDGVIYHLFNILGGIALTVNTVYFSAWAAAFINFAWAGIAVIGWIKVKRINP